MSKDSLFETAVEGYPKPAQQKLRTIRKLIFDTAAKTDGVGALEEALKWGQLSFLTADTKSGTTIRLGQAKGRGDTVALFVHCQTSLVKTYRELYPDKFEFEGNRALIMNASRPIPKAELAHCIALALTYHQRK